MVWCNSIINSPTLTAASVGINNLEPVTPNHLLIGKSSPKYKPCAFQEQNISLRKKWRAVQAATDMFREKLLKKYLPALTE